MIRSLAPRSALLRQAVASDRRRNRLAPAFAAGSNMPWEQPLQQILQSIEGPVSKIIAVIIIIVTGLTLAFGDTSGGFRRLDPDRVRPVDRVRGLIVLPVVLLLRRRSADLMTTSSAHELDSRVRGAGPSRPDRTDPARPARRAPSRSSTARSRPRLAWGCASGSPVSCSGRSATWPRSGPPSAIRSSSMWCAGTCAIRRISAREVTPC